ncbi:MAG: glycine C-acetyltransferase [Gammaproteobacteria bacterium]|nr:glycine C-acetyltransferase [Gammaproteobacteria bacterium]
MHQAFLDYLSEQTATLRSEGLFKDERVITTPQGPDIAVADGKEVINFCANNYLGLSNHPQLVTAAQDALARYGFGLSSVRFICGTQTIHKELEKRLSQFLKTEDTILYPSAFDANGGLFETLLGPEDAVISDALNHASIIDGIRLCKAKRLRYQHGDMQELEERLQEAKTARFRMIATDGVFSMDGTVARLPQICDLADKYDAMVMIDDCHASGFLGANGRGTHEYHDVVGRVDIITGTLGKALGGASGGFTAARKEIVAWLRQRSRPYLFSNTLMPAIAAASVAALDILESSSALRDKLRDNTAYFRKHIQALGFEIIPGDHPIIPIMLGDARLAAGMADRLLSEGIYVIGFSFPVVPRGQARIRTQMSSAHDREHLDRALAAFEKVGQEMGVTVTA